MFDDVSPVKKSAAFMAFMLMAAVLLFSKVLLPYYDYLRLLSDCNMECQATIFTAEEQDKEKDDIYYYGPTVEFTPDGFLPIHCRAVNTVKTRAKFQPGQQITIRYDGTINSDIIIMDDTTCRDNLVYGSVFAGMIALIGIIDFIVHFATRNRVPKGETKKFSTTPDGLSFDEWQELKKLEEFREAGAEAGDDPTDEK